MAASARRTRAAEPTCNMCAGHGKYRYGGRQRWRRAIRSGHGYFVLSYEMIDDMMWVLAGAPVAAARRNRRHPARPTEAATRRRLPAAAMRCW